MSDLEIRIQQIMTMLQGPIMDEQHPLGQIFRKVGELQGRGESDQHSNADQATLNEYQRQMDALDLDGETRAELTAAFRNETSQVEPQAPVMTGSLDVQILDDLMRQLSSIQNAILDPGLDPAAALAVIRPFYGEASAMVQNIADSLNLNGNAVLSSLQNVIRSQGF